MSAIARTASLAPHRRRRVSESSPESRYLRRWVAHQAARYADLLSTIDAAEHLHHDPGHGGSSRPSA